MPWLVGLLLVASGIVAQDEPWNARVDCLPAPSATKEKCLAASCIWDPNPDSTKPTFPLCYYPSAVGGYEVTSSGKINTLSKRSDGPKNPFGADITPIYQSTSQIGATLNVKIGTTDRYEIPAPVRIPKEKSVSSDGLNFEVATQSPFAFRIRRKSTQQIIWDTTIGGLVFSDKFIQIATYLPSKKIYGFGEHAHHELQHNLSQYTTWPMFTRPEGPEAQQFSIKNLYGVHPFYLCMETDNKAHGVFFWNSNAQEVTTGPAPHLIYRTVGGVLDIYFFPGPTAEEVVQQYLALIGRPMIPAYYALGYQLSRWGYKNLQDLKDSVARVQNAGIPLDVPYADVDYMDQFRDFTLGSDWLDFPNYAKELHNAGLHLSLIFDPAVAVNHEVYERAIQAKASFVEWERLDQVPQDINGLYPLTKDSKVMLGVTMPDKHVAFPDFMDTTNSTLQWWINEFVKFHDRVPFDGIWLDMNEPENDYTNDETLWRSQESGARSLTNLHCPLTGADSEFDAPPYETWAAYQYDNGHLSSKTLCMLAVTGRQTQRLYNTKNLYGLSEAMATQSALYSATGKRGTIISRSTFPSSGRFTGHWLGDNMARWEDLQVSVIGVQEFNMFGIPYVGADICGFLLDTTEELCLRWHQLGAFHPFARNHNEMNAVAQDPAQWPSVAAAAREALLLRYTYLPYLYSLHFEASVLGGTVVRPVFFEFPLDEKTHNLGHQFMWGSAFMIVPVLEQGVSQVTGYLPESFWYSVRDLDYGKMYEIGSQQFSAPTTGMIPVFVRGGRIVPRQKPDVTTTKSRTNPLELLIAIDMFPLVRKSTGNLYWDDGESIIRDINSYDYFTWLFEFAMDENTAQLTIQSVKSAPNIPVPHLDVIEVFGYGDFEQLEKTLKVNGVATSVTMERLDNDVLRISAPNFIDLGVAESSYTVTWKHYLTWNKK